MSTVLERPVPAARARPLLPAAGRLIPWLTLGAVLLRLALFLGRGNYVAFDEAWYLILGHNLWTGHGYTMSGLRQVALSPLFPLAAGAVGRLLGSDVWGGRIVAALASGLLVLPCWSIFRRLAGRRTALLACGIIAVLPSLAAFVTPELVGWDLWAGAGPLGYLFGLTGIALLLAGLERRPALRWALAGAAFALAYLDRPEALAVAALAGAAALALAGVRRLPRLVLPALVGATAFAVVAAPYWIYLHDTVGRWTLTGRGVAVLTMQAARTMAKGVATDVAGTVEQMLWNGNQARYAGNLYRLDPSDTRMADSYWGVPAPGRHPSALPPAPAPPGTTSPALAPASAATTSPAAAPAPSATTSPAAAPAASAATASPAAAPLEPPVPTVAPPTTLERLDFYRRALGLLLPWLLWPFAAAGLLIPGRRRYLHELAAFAPVVLTALVVATFVAVDARTQLLLVPVLTWYAARGLTLFAGFLRPRLGRGVRRGFAFTLVSGTAIAVLLGMDLYRLWMGASEESIRQVIGDANLEVAGELDRLVPPGATVMSWSPALAAWARRDWRPLPTAPLPRVLRFADNTRTHWIVFSTINPSPLPRAEMPRVYLIVNVPPGASAARAWRIDVFRFADQHAVGRLVPLGS